MQVSRGLTPERDECAVPESEWSHRRPGKPAPICMHVLREGAAVRLERSKKGQLPARLWEKAGAKTDCSTAEGGGCKPISEELRSLESPSL